MNEQQYLPEGSLLATEHNRRMTADHTALAEAALEGVVLEAVATVCDAEHHLHVSLPCMEGIIPHEEGALGIAEGTTRDIAVISRVGKPVCFMVMGFEHTPDGMRAVLSRRAAQAACRRHLLTAHRVGDILRARVTRLESFGAFCDIGCGVSALMPIAGMSVSRISHPADRLQVGMDILGVITSKEDGRICLSQRELLGTWEQNVCRFSQGETVVGIVRSVESYGVFVELTPNLAGLAEPHGDLRPGMQVSAYIKSILPEKMKVKLIIIDQAGEAPPPDLPTYYIREGHIDHWIYSPPGAQKCIQTVFDDDER